MPPIIDDEKCIVCGTCVDVCPQDVFFGSRENEIPLVSYAEECWHCDACVQECPVDAVRLRIPLPASVLFKDE